MEKGNLELAVEGSKKAIEDLEKVWMEGAKKYSAELDSLSPLVDSLSDPESKAWAAFFQARMEEAQINMQKALGI